VIDCCSRKLAGWAVADHMRTELVETAPKAALADRGSLRGAIFHADHGAQYTSKDYAQLCKQLGVTRSLGGVGSSADNALAEAFNATLKRETLAGAPVFPDEASCPPRDLPLGGPLQHPQAPLLLRPPIPERLREPTRGYPSGSSVIKHTPCPRFGGKAPRRGHRRSANPSGESLRSSNPAPGTRHCTCHRVTVVPRGPAGGPCGGRVKMLLS
jgi:transposase InsO family protein